MARKHKARTQRKRPLTSRERQLKRFEQRLQHVDQEIDKALDQQLHYSELLLSHRHHTTTVQIKLEALITHTRSLQTQLQHRRQWISRLRNQSTPLRDTLAQTIQSTNRTTLEARGPLRRYPRSSFYAHWDNPPIGPLEPTRVQHRHNSTRIQRRPVNLATRTSRQHPIDLSTDTNTASPTVTDLTHL